MHAESKGICVLARISDDIWEAVEKCGICQASSRVAKLIGNVSEAPLHAWHTLGTDLFYWNKMDYLVLGGYFSKFLVVRKLPNTSTHMVIKGNNLYRIWKAQCAEELQ